MISSLKELIDEPELENENNSEERFIRGDLSWQNYEELLVKLADNSHYRMSFFEGILEIVSPSIRHERIKKKLALLLERFFYHQRIQFVPTGSFTIKNQAKQAGLEPDESYYFGKEKIVPDLAIEVVITSGNLEKLAIYRRLGVIEVWFWERNKIKLFHLRDLSNSEKASFDSDSYGYEPISTSKLLPNLNISLLERCVLMVDSIQAIDEFEKGLKS